jgi:hypothetical protein
MTPVYNKKSDDLEPGVSPCLLDAIFIVFSWFSAISRLLIQYATTLKFATILKYLYTSVQ